MGQPAADAGPTPTQLILLPPADIGNHSGEPEQLAPDEINAAGRRKTGDREPEAELGVELNRSDRACHARCDSSENPR